MDEEMTIEEALEIVTKTYKGKLYSDLTVFEKEQLDRLLPIIWEDTELLTSLWEETKCP